jgi:hypothetical protein
VQQIILCIREGCGSYVTPTDNSKWEGQNSRLVYERTHKTYLYNGHWAWNNLKTLRSTEFSVLNSASEFCTRTKKQTACTAASTVMRHWIKSVCLSFLVILSTIEIRISCGTEEFHNTGRRKTFLCLLEKHTFTLTLILLTCRIWWAPNNASRWQMGFNSAFKGLNLNYIQHWRYFA